MSKKKNKGYSFEERNVVDQFEDEATQKIEAPKGVVSNGMIKVTPLKDWHIKFNEHDIKLKEGEAIEVPKIFEQSLKIEKVIN